MNTKNNRFSPLCGEVYLVRFSGIGSVQSGLRPAVVFQNNIGNIYSPNVTVLPMTSSIKKLRQDTHVFIPANGTGLLRDSMVICENPVCIPKDKLGSYLTSLPKEYLGKIAMASILASSAIAYLDQDKIKDLHNRAAELNSVRCCG